jgi:hypothetical protein
MHFKTIQHLQKSQFHLKCSHTKNMFILLKKVVHYENNE